MLTPLHVDAPTTDQFLGSEWQPSVHEMEPWRQYRRVEPRRPMQSRHLLSQPKAWRNIYVLWDLWNWSESRGPLMSYGRAFHQAGATAKKALPLVEGSRMSLRWGVTSSCWRAEHKAFWGSCRHVSPRPCRALKVNVRTLALIQYSTGGQCGWQSKACLGTLMGVPGRTHTAALWTAEVSRSTSRAALQYTISLSPFQPNLGCQGD